MRLPWFMHMHAGVNGLTGVLPTPVGVFVRSCADGRMEVSWYPTDLAFKGGGDRRSERLATVDATDEGEQALERAVVDFMHAHPALAMQKRWDEPAGAPLDWQSLADGAIATHEEAGGLFLRVRHGETVDLEFIPLRQGGGRERLGSLSDLCDEYTLHARIDARVRRRVERLRAERAVSEGVGAA